jgi:16S rRNA (guanine527-N7)-methyltransferase
MTEDEARLWIRERFGVPRETLLDRYEALLREEAVHQNLIAASTLETLWARHLVDSAQLVLLAQENPFGLWVDIGTGAGLPGVVVAALTERPVVLVEPRARRVAFLNQVVEALELGDRVTVAQSRIEGYVPPAPADVISARAVAALPALLKSAQHCAVSRTLWILPKGRTAQSEVEDARKAWQGSFHVEQSITQSDSLIVLARKVVRR